MSDSEKAENENRDATLYINIAEATNVEPPISTPAVGASEMPAQPNTTTVNPVNPSRHHSIATANLGRFNMETPRALRNSTSLAENISSTIEGFRPLVERVSSHPRLASWLSIQRRGQDPPNPSSPSSDSYIINLDLDPRATGHESHNGVIAQRSSMMSPAHGDAEQRHCQFHNRFADDRNENNDGRVEDQNCSDENNENRNNLSAVNNAGSNNSIAGSEEEATTNAAGGGNGAVGSEDNPVSESSEDLPISPEMRALLIILKRYVPYIVILLVKIVYDHSVGILNLLLLFVTFVCANNDLKREIAKQQNKSWVTLGRILCQIAGCFFLISFVFGDNVPIFYTEPATMWELLWSVAVMDFTIKLITVAVKVLLTCLPLRLLAIPKRGKFYLMIEATSQLYRCGAPIKPWLCYLLDAYQGPQKIFGVILSLAYAISKTSDVMPRFNLFCTAAYKMLQNFSLGVVPSKEQLVAAGGICAICHEEYTTPVKLRCKHIFCEACVSTWLDRERSCPLCRVAITDDPIYRDGHTTHFIQLY